MVTAVRDRQTLLHPRPSFRRPFQGTSYGRASLDVGQPFPDFIEIMGMDGYYLVPFTEETTKPLISMFIQFPVFAESMGVARNALAAFDGATGAGGWAAAERAVRPFVQRRVDGRRDGSLISYALLDPNGELVGGTSMWPTPSPIANTFEIGVFARPDHWHTGLALNAVRVNGAMALDDLGAQRLEMTTDESNAACRRLCERLGFTDNGFVRRMQHGMESPTKVWTRWYSWDSAALREPASPRNVYVHQSKRRVRRDFESERFLAERQFELVADPEHAREVVADARRELERHFGDPSASPEAAFDIATHLRALVFGAGARIWTLMALQVAIDHPHWILDALSNPTQKTNTAWEEYWAGTKGSVTQTMLEFKNPSIPKFEIGSNDGEFLTSVMRFFTDVRLSHMETVPEYQPLLDLCGEMQHEWRTAAGEAGKLENYEPTKPPRRLAGWELRSGIVDPLGGTISDALVTLDFILKHAPEAARRECAQTGHSPPGNPTGRKARFSNDDLQRAILRSNDAVTGVLVELGRKKMELATGKGKLGRSRGPFRADELGFDIRDPYNPAFFLTGQGLHNSPARVPQGCPADSDLPGANMRERYTVAASHDDGVLFNYLPLSQKNTPDPLSTETATLRVAALFLPLLWEGESNEFCDVGPGRSSSLAGRQRSAWEGIDIPRSEKEMTWGMGPTTRFDVAQESEIRLPCGGGAERDF
jgi:RimJ/RimL family protein N-acetyltransferase